MAKRMVAATTAQATVETISLESVHQSDGQIILAVAQLELMADLLAGFATGDSFDTFSEDNFLALAHHIKTNAKTITEAHDLVSRRALRLASVESGAANV